MQKYKKHLNISYPYSMSSSGSRERCSDSSMALGMDKMDGIVLPKGWVKFIEKK